MGAPRKQTGSRGFPCPFKNSGCEKTFPGEPRLKVHLRSLSKHGDEHHPLMAEWWNENQAYLRIYTRPGNLTDEQKKIRHKEAQKRNYEKDKTRLLAKQKADRLMKKEAAVLALDLSATLKSTEDRVKALDQSFKNQSAIITTLFGDVPTIDEWLDADLTTAQQQERQENPLLPNPDDPDTDPRPTTLYHFPRFVTYYLPQGDWPNALNHNTDNPFRTAIPVGGHFQQVQGILHPDKETGDPRLSKMLNAGFDLWRAHHIDTRIAQQVMGYHDVQEFLERPQPAPMESRVIINYGELSGLFDIWADVQTKSQLAMSPQNISTRRMHVAFAECQNLASGVTDPTRDAAQSPEVSDMFERVSNIRDPRIPKPPGRPKRKQIDEGDGSDVVMSSNTSESGMGTSRTGAPRRSARLRSS
jgi:hypothetical protein